MTKKPDRIIAYKAIDISFINQRVMCIRYQKMLNDTEYKEQYTTDLSLYNWNELSYEEPQENNVER